MNKEEYPIEEELEEYMQICERLQQRIDKALEYINDRYDYEQNVLMHTFDRDNLKELYEILGGNND